MREREEEERNPMEEDERRARRLKKYGRMPIC
jgi:hypothetical protein